MPLPSIEEADIEDLLLRLNAGAAVDDRLELDAARRAVIGNYEDVQACPGSGKTTLVAIKLLLLGSKWTDRNAGICVLTHTNVAKDQIVARLRRHPSGRKLLSYPHFIGTIQDFVHRFFALPYCRSLNIDPRQIDDEALLEKMDAKLG